MSNAVIHQCVNYAGVQCHLLMSGLKAQVKACKKDCKCVQMCSLDCQITKWNINQLDSWPLNHKFNRKSLIHGSPMALVRLITHQWKSQIPLFKKTQSQVTSWTSRGKKAPERNSTLCISTTQSKDISGSPLKGVFFFFPELHKRMGLDFVFHYNAQVLLTWREVRTHGTIPASIFCSPSTTKSFCRLFLYLALTASCTRQSFIRQWGTRKGALWTRLPVHKKCKDISQ